MREEGRLGDFRRTDPAMSTAFSRLSAEAERVRVALSETEQVTFEVADLGRGSDGQPVGFSRTLDRELLESLITPIITKTTELCKLILSRNRMTSNSLKGIVLVGGPTRTPALQRIIEAELGLDASHQMDPTIIVAVGAALFASTQKLPAALRPATSACLRDGRARARVRIDDDESLSALDRQDGGGVPPRRAFGADSGRRPGRPV